MLNEELDVLEIKLEELYDFVDKFIIIEATRTHTNLPKKLYYLENEQRFAKYKDKIVHLICNFNDTHLYRNHREVYNRIKPVNDVWFREHFQRDFGIINGQVQFDDEDIIIVTDLDEIVNKHSLSKFITESGIDKIYRLGMSLHYYKFNLKAPYPAVWRHPYIARYKHLKEFDFAISYIRDSYKFHEFHEILVDNMGWHFTYLMSANDIINKKFKHFVHATDDNIKNVTEEKIVDDMNNKIFFHYTLSECSVEELPETVRRLYKYSTYFHKEHP